MYLWLAPNGIRSFPFLFIITTTLFHQLRLKDAAHVRQWWCVILAVGLPLWKKYFVLVQAVAGLACNGKISLSHDTFNAVRLRSGECGVKAWWNKKCYDCRAHSFLEDKWWHSLDINLPCKVSRGTHVTVTETGIRIKKAINLTTIAKVGTRMGEKGVKSRNGKNTDGAPTFSVSTSSYTTTPYWFPAQLSESSVER